MVELHNKCSNELNEINDLSIDALVTDPPYGINYQGNTWDKELPDNQIWINSHRVMKHGAFGAVFSSIRNLHKITTSLEENGFIIRDVLMWVYLNGMPKNRNVALDIDKELGVDSEKVGEYKYTQGYRTNNEPSDYKAKNKSILKPTSELAKKYEGSGISLKPAYEPIILIQKPIEKGFTIAQNVIKNGTGLLNIENSRVPYEIGEKRIGHNPHPIGRYPSNIWRTDNFNDGYDKFFMVAKVRKKSEDYNNHPTQKPVKLMSALINLLSFDGQRILDPFMGSGTTGVATIENNRSFVGYEKEKEYFEICKKRING